MMTQDPRHVILQLGNNGVPALRLAVLSCEDSDVYGTSVPRMLCQILEHTCRTTVPSANHRSIHLTLYDCKQSEYPADAAEWDSFHGFVLPGSLSSATDDAPWMRTLCDVIRNELHGNRRPTLGICFGHQIYAHALGGRVRQNPAGLQVCEAAFELTAPGVAVLGARADHQPHMRLLCSHGDMVDSLPPVAVALGGNPTVPVQAAAYFGTVEEAQAAARDPKAAAAAYAITVQAHPEYSTPHGLQALEGVLRFLVETDQIPEQVVEDKRGGLASQQPQQDSVTFMGSVLRQLGWIADAAAD